MTSPQPFRIAALAGVLCLISGEAMAGNVRVCDRPPGARPPLPSVDDQTGGDIPHGWSHRLPLTVENRKLLSAGEITPEEAQARGGVAMTGTFAFPVFPLLYDNTETAPAEITDIKATIFGSIPTGSVREYYEEISYGQLTIDASVDDWFQVAEEDTYYEGMNNGLEPRTDRTDEAMLEILMARDGEIDFGLFDNDGADGFPNSGDDDGYVDLVVFLTPEPSASCGGNSNIWAHQSGLSNWTGTYFETDDTSAHPSIGNIRINSYFISSATPCSGAGALPIGTFCHELGHALGIADLYDTNDDNGPSSGIGFWGLMGSGNWNQQTSPAHMCGWSKERLGWLTWFDVSADAQELCLPPLETQGAAARMWTNGDIGDEYFVVENRQPIGFDQHLPAPGLVIYHVDEQVYRDERSENMVNGDETRKAIDVECADAGSAGHVTDADDLDADANRGDAGDVWCAATQSFFDDTTIPNSRSYSGVPTEVAVRNIDTCGDASGWICADFEVGIPSTANLCMRDCESEECQEFTSCEYFWATTDLWLDNEEDGNPSYPAEGMANKLFYRVFNQDSEPISDVRIEVHYADPGMGMLWPSTATGLLGAETISIIGGNDVVEDFIEIDYPTPPPGVDHYCLGAIVTHPLDPQNSEWAPNDNNLVQINHQVLVQRAEGGAFARTSGGAFHAESVIKLWACQEEDQQTLAEVRFGTPPSYDDWWLPSGWSVSIEPGMVHLLTSCEPGEILVKVESPEAQHGQTGHLPLTLVNLETEEPLGGVILDYEVDCVAPTAPAGGTAHCLSAPGDAPETASTVEVSWDPITIDIDGDPEQIKFYEIYRSTDGGAESLVATTAIDENPDAPGFQWYDDALMDIGVTHVYRVRGFDRADNPGLFSGDLEIDCALVSVDVGTVTTPLVMQLAQNRPNPFRPRTAIEFTLPAQSHVTLEIFDLVGRRVRTLLNTALGAGPHAIEWDGRTQSGEPVAAGVYAYRLSGNGETITRKMTVVR